MRNLYKKITALALAVAVIFCLAACGGGAATPPAATTPDTPDTSATAPATSTDDGFAGTIKIGLLLNVTGWFASNDLSNLYESQAFVDVINSQGGWDVDGQKYKLELVISDIQSDFGNVNSAAMYLIDQGVDFVVETLDFFISGAAPLFEEKGVMNVCMLSTGDPTFPDPNCPHSFLAGLNGTANQTLMGVRMMTENFPDVKTAVYTENDNGSNQATWDLLNKACEQYGITLLPNSVLYPGDSPDLAAVALQLVNSGADGILTQGSFDAMGSILKEVRNLGSDMPMDMFGLISPEMITQSAGADNAYNFCNLMYSQAPEDNIDIYNQMRAQVVKDHGEDAAVNTVGAFVNAEYVLLNMISMAKSLDVDTVMNTWTNATSVDTLYGPGTIGGAETYGMPGHAVGSPTSFMIMTKDGVVYKDRIETVIP